MQTHAELLPVLPVSKLINSITITSTASLSTSTKRLLQWYRKTTYFHDSLSRELCSAVLSFLVPVIVLVIGCLLCQSASFQFNGSYLNGLGIEPDAPKPRHLNSDSRRNSAPFSLPGDLEFCGLPFKLHRDGSPRGQGWPEPCRRSSFAQPLP